MWWSLVTSFNVIPYTHNGLIRRVEKKNWYLPFGCLVCFGRGHRYRWKGQLKKMVTRLIQSTELIRGQDPHSSSLLHLQVSNVQSCTIWNLECKCHESHFVISCWFPYKKESLELHSNVKVGLYSNPPRLERHLLFSSRSFFCIGANLPPSVSRGMQQIPLQFEPPSLKLANITLLEGECTIAYWVVGNSCPVVLRPRCLFEYSGGLVTSNLLNIFWTFSGRGLLNWVRWGLALLIAKLPAKRMVFSKVDQLF